jgi:hypothetical protein
VPGYAEPGRLLEGGIFFPVAQQVKIHGCRILSKTFTQPEGGTYQLLRLPDLFSSGLDGEADAFKNRLGGRLRGQVRLKIGEN